jgi:hypothetical protein
MDEKKVCILTKVGKRTKRMCKCSRNGKRVACSTLKALPKLPLFKMPDFLNFSKKLVHGKKGRYHIGGTRKTKLFDREFFFSAACKKKGKTIKCDNMFGW